MKERRVIFGGQGIRTGFCRQCHPEKKDDKVWYHNERMRAVYIRKPTVGFKRIGWQFEKCGHIELD